MKHPILITLALLVSSFAFGQRAKHGSISTSGNQILNEYTEVLADITAGQLFISVQTATLNNNARFTGDLAPGDLIMIYQAQGASIKSVNDSSYGEITAYNGAGTYEFLEVKSITGSNTIDLECGVQNNYSTAGHTQVVRVPRLAALTVNFSDTIKGESWDGDKGGLVVLEVDGLVSVQGVIDASEIGFRGGACAVQTNPIFPWAGEHLLPNDGHGAEKGESIAGYYTEYDAAGGRFCKGAPANGGGGGNGGDTGGGGGANGGDVANWSGKGNPDFSNPNYITAWNLEAPYLSSHTSDGGGRGGYSYATVSLDPLVYGPTDTAWGGGERKINGGLGGRPVENDASKLFFGGGGGAGFSSDLFKSKGGAGGGLIYLLTTDDVSGTGSILSNGEMGESHQNVDQFFFPRLDGAGGAGAGGSIVMKSLGAISVATIEAKGNRGGIVIRDIPFNVNAEAANGPGGGGGGGYVSLSNAATVDVSGGVSGTFQSIAFTNFPMNGATDGGEGDSKVEVYNPIKIDVSDVTTCPGYAVTLTATVQNGNAADLKWFDAYSGGTQVGTGATFITPVLNSNTTYYVGLCGLEYKDTVNVIMGNAISLALTNDTSICSGGSLTLNVSGADSYVWWPNSNINNTTIASPIVNPTSTITYYVEGTVGGCKDTDSVVVSVSSVLSVDLGVDKHICKGDSVELVSGIGNAWSWTPINYITSTSDSVVKVFPPDTLEFFVNVTNAQGCMGRDSIWIFVTEKLQITSISDQEFCINANELVNVTTSGGGPGPFTYTWNDGQTGSSRNLVLNQDTSLTVTVIDPLTGCSDQESFDYGVREVNPSFSATAGCLNEVTSFSDQTVLSKGTIDTRAWDLGDGNTESNASFNHTYSALGNQLVQLTVTDDLGCSGTEQKWVTVYSIPSVEIGENDTIVCIGASLSYSDSSSATQNLSSWYWLMGNGDSLLTQHGTYTHPVAGDFNVVLVGENANGCSSKDTIGVEVLNMPTANFQLQDTVAHGEKIKIESTSLNATNYEWKYLGTNVGFSKEVIVGFSNIGPNCLTLAIADAFNCTDTIVKCTYVTPASLSAVNVITPNGDGFNEAFVLEGTEGRVLSLNVFNRWGKLVYANEDYQNDWAGLNLNNILLKPGNYFYILKDTQTGQAWNGFVNIIY